MFFHKNNDQLWLHPTIEGPYGLKSFYRQSWEPCIPLEPGTHFPVELKKKIIYQEPFGTDSIFKLVLPVSVELSEPEQRLVAKCSFLMGDMGLFSFGTQ